MYPIHPTIHILTDVVKRARKVRGQEIYKFVDKNYVAEATCISFSNYKKEAQY